MNSVLKKTESRVLGFGFWVDSPGRLFLVDLCEVPRQGIRVLKFTPLNLDLSGPSPKPSYMTPRLQPYSISLRLNDLSQLASGLDRAGAQSRHLNAVVLAENLGNRILGFRDEGVLTRA